MKVSTFFTTDKTSHVATPLYDVQFDSSDKIHKQVVEFKQKTLWLKKIKLYIYCLC